MEIRNIMIVTTLEAVSYALWQVYSSDINVVPKSLIKTDEEIHLLKQLIKIYAAEIDTTLLGADSWYKNIEDLLK